MKKSHDQKQKQKTSSQLKSSDKNKQKKSASFNQRKSEPAQHEQQKKDNLPNCFKNISHQTNQGGQPSHLKVRDPFALSLVAPKDF